MRASLKSQSVGRELQAVFTGIRMSANPSVYDSIARAATATIKDAGSLLKNEGRAEIASGGFSPRWQNAWRVNTYPASGVSINAAAFGFHKIPYSLVFEQGARITARKGLLWIPLPTVPKDGRKRNYSPRALTQSGVDLFSISRPGRKPLLAAKARVSGGIGQSLGTKRRNQRGRVTFGGRALSLAQLRAGKKGPRQTVPLFVGVNVVTLRKRFNLEGVADSVSARLGSLYFANLKA